MSTPESPAALWVFAAYDAGLLVAEGAGAGGRFQEVGGGHVPSFLPLHTAPSAVQSVVGEYHSDVGVAAGVNPGPGDGPAPRTDPHACPQGGLSPAELPVEFFPPSL